MLRPTLSNFRAQFPSEAMGICQADPKVKNYCNDAQERLLIDPLTPDEGWWGGWVTLNLSVSVSGAVAYVTTPREIARLIVLGVCQNPVHIRNGFYEYLAFGKGLQPKTCQATGCGSTFQAIERDSVVTLSSLSGTKTIRLYPTDARDSGRRVLLQGKDQNGQIILTTDPGTGLSAPGEYVVLAFPFVNSVNQFSSLSGIMKDETYGPVQIFQVDITSGTEYTLSSMEPNEGTAWYRRYLINGIPNTNLCCTGTGHVQLQAQGKLDFLPVENENDYLTIPNVPALIEEAMSIRYSRMDGGASQAALHHAAAINLLNGQLDHYEGKINTAIKVPIFGSNRMRRQPV